MRLQGPAADTPACAVFCYRLNKFCTDLTCGLSKRVVRLVVIQYLVFSKGNKALRLHWACADGPPVIVKTEFDNSAFQGHSGARLRRRPPIRESEAWPCDLKEDQRNTLQRISAYSYPMTRAGTQAHEIRCLQAKFSFERGSPVNLTHGCVFSVEACNPLTSPECQEAQHTVREHNGM